MNSKLIPRSKQFRYLGAYKVRFIRHCFALPSP
jgi:hypothetical protein